MPARPAATFTCLHQNYHLDNITESLWPSKVQGFFTVQGIFHSSKFSQGFFHG